MESNLIINNHIDEWKKILEDPNARPDLRDFAELITKHCAAKMKNCAKIEENTKLMVKISQDWTNLLELHQQRYKRLLWVYRCIWVMWVITIFMLIFLK
jgi:hypothetical protein